MPRTLFLPLGLLAVVLSAPAAAEPDPKAELSRFQQAQDYRNAVADRADSAFQTVLEDQTLLGALAGAYLRPEATSGSFGNADDGYAYTVDVAWKPNGSMTGITSQLASALGSARTGSTFCFGDGTDVAARMTVQPGLEAVVLDQLGITPATIAPQDRILGDIGGQPAALNPQSMGPMLFAAVLSEVKGSTRPERVSLTLFAPKPLNAASDADERLRLTTTTNRVIEVPVDIVGGAVQLDPEAIKEARWRIAGTNLAIPVDPTKPIQNVLLAQALNTGVARLSNLQEETVFPVRRQRVALPDHEMHFLGARNAWYGVVEVEGGADVSVARTTGTCDVAVQLSAQDSQVRIIGLSTASWSKVETFRLVDPTVEAARLAFLDPPAPGKDPSGISNEDFDERLTREQRCVAACPAVATRYDQAIREARQAWEAEAKAQAKNRKITAEYVPPSFNFAEVFSTERCEAACLASAGYAQCVEELPDGGREFLRAMDICEAKSPFGLNQGEQ